MTDDDLADHQPEPAAAGKRRDDHRAAGHRDAQWPAWSVEEPATVAFPRPWRSVWAIVGIGLFSGVVIAFAIFGVVALLKDDRPPPTTPACRRRRSPVTDDIGCRARTTVATVTAQPAPTVTVTPPPATVTAQAALPPAAGGTDVFTICPDGHEGVVGGHTTCAFAANVRQIFYATGMSNDFTAYSPVTGEGYEMTCVGRYSAHFSDGSTKISTRCYGGDNAEVVIW